MYLSLTHQNSRFSGYNAVARNKIIYALSDYAMIVTCSFVADANGKPYPNKGGTWVGAHECAKFNLSKLLVRNAGDKPPLETYFFQMNYTVLLYQKQMFTQYSTLTKS